MSHKFACLSIAFMLLLIMSWVFEVRLCNEHFASGGGEKSNSLLEHVIRVEDLKMVKRKKLLSERTFEAPANKCKLSEMK